MKKLEDIDVMIADESHEVYVEKILETIRESAKVRGTGIAERTPEYVTSKIREGKAIIALDGQNFAGFSYIESWGHKSYVATSGLIVHPDYRDLGLAKRDCPECKNKECFVSRPPQSWCYVEESEGNGLTTLLDLCKSLRRL